MKKFKLTKDCVHKFADIRNDQISTKAQDFLNNHGLVYQDKILSENLLSIENAIESAQEEGVPIHPDLQDELDQIQAEINRVDAIYLRIIY